MTNWLRGEYGDTLRVLVPFSVGGSLVALKIRPPYRGWREWEVDAQEDSAIEHVILVGELDAVGTYRGVVESLAGGRLRKALFSFTVGGLV